MKLNLVKSEADCTVIMINSLNAHNEGLEMTLSEMDLFLDKNIKDKQTLESKILPIRKKRELIDKKVAEFDKQIAMKCSGKK